MKRILLLSAALLTLFGCTKTPTDNPGPEGPDNPVDPSGPVIPDPPTPSFTVTTLFGTAGFSNPVSGKKDGGESEAVLGAVYLDGGLEEVRAILNKFHFPRVQEIISAEDFINHKSELLEYLQGKLRTVPEYIVVDESGPEHQKLFTVEVHVDGKVYGRGQGGNKKKAEQEASRVSLEMLLAEAAKAEAEKGPEEPKPKKQKQRHVGLP